jgi:hypothetical protein
MFISTLFNSVLFPLSYFKANIGFWALVQFDAQAGNVLAITALLKLNFQVILCFSVIDFQ